MKDWLSRGGALLIALLTLVVATLFIAISGHQPPEFHRQNLGRDDQKHEVQQPEEPQNISSRPLGSVFAPSADSEGRNQAQQSESEADKDQPVNNTIERRNLAAQEGIRVASERMAAHSQIAMWVSILTAIFLGYTLYQTRRTADAAARTAEAAEATESAHLSVEVGAQAPEFMNDKLPVVASVRNEGRTPARNLAIRIEQMLGEELITIAKADIAFLGSKKSAYIPVESVYDGALEQQALSGRPYNVTVRGSFNSVFRPKEAILFCYTAVYITDDNAARESDNFFWHVIEGPYDPALDEKPDS